MKNLQEQTHQHDGIELELREQGRWPATESVAYAAMSFGGLALAGNQVAKDYVRIQRLEALPREKLTLGQVEEVGMARKLPGAYYGGRALLNPCAAPAGLVAALVLTAAYAGAKRAYTNLRQFLTQHR